MLIFPAIDIIGGKVVRLLKGDYGAVKKYRISCAEAAASFAAGGAKHIHAVDLDGAANGKAVNAASVAQIIGAAGCFVEVGGGIRCEKQIESYLAAGAGRVILGTAAVRDFGFTAALAEKYGEKIAVGVDAAEGKVAVSGWKEITDINSIDFCEKLCSAGVKTVIYTDISRDGTLSGTNTDVYRELVGIKGLKITASGGITSIREIEELKNMGVYAAILGKALYENKISLAAAVAAAEE